MLIEGKETDPMIADQSEFLAVGTTGGPTVWRRELTAAACSSPPDGVALHRWRQLVGDGLMLTDAWGAHAQSLGWSATELFGAHRLALGARVDLLGLVWMLEGRQVTDITAESAVIDIGRGGTQRYRRKTLGGAVVPLWALVTPAPQVETTGASAAA
jgi:hypothetical protein